MANNSLTILTNRFFALVLKSPIQTGWLSIINSVTNISRLGTFKVSPTAAALIPDERTTSSKAVAAVAAGAVSAAVAAAAAVAALTL